jgi:hypothetical protein
MITESAYEGMACQWITSMSMEGADKCPDRREYGKPYCLVHCQTVYQPLVCEPVERAPKA